MIEFKSEVGSIKFQRTALREEVIVEFNFLPGSAGPAAAVCRDAFEKLFSEMGVLIIRGYIDVYNYECRHFSNLVGLSTVGRSDRIVEKRLTKARWEHLKMSKRAAVIDASGSVVNVIVADAETDKLPDYTLVDITELPEVMQGYMWDGAIFTVGRELAL